MKKTPFLLLFLASYTVYSQQFEYSVTTITPETLARMPHTWRNDAPIALDDLRHVAMIHYNFDGKIQQGELIAHKETVDDLIAIFQQLFAEKFPITSIRFVDEFDGSDLRSMQANNTCMFYARMVARTARWSNHSFGCAIDINPLLNPYSRGDFFTPREGQAYLDRSLDLPGMITKESLMYKLFIERGWQWGGECFYERDGTIDRHHFQKIIPGVNKNTN